MNKFETPVIEIEELKIADIITSSNCPEDQPAACEFDAGGF